MINFKTEFYVKSEIIIKIITPHSISLGSKCTNQNNSEIKWFEFHSVNQM